MTMVRLRGAVLLIAAAGTLTGRLAGLQAPILPLSTGNEVPRSAPVPRDTVRLRALLMRIHDQASLRVGVSGRSRISGRYADIVGDTIVLLTTATQERLPLASIDSLWARQQPIAPRAVRGALVGGLLAAVHTLIRTLHVSCHSPPSTLFDLFPSPACRTTVGNVGRATALGALAGAAVGAAIGKAFPRWRLRFP